MAEKLPRIGLKRHSSAFKTSPSPPMVDGQPFAPRKGPQVAIAKNFLAQGEKEPKPFAEDSFERINLTREDSLDPSVSSSSKHRRAIERSRGVGKGECRFAAAGKRKRESSGLTASSWLAPLACGSACHVSLRMHVVRRRSMVAARRISSRRGLGGRMRGEGRSAGV